MVDISKAWERKPEFSDHVFCGKLDNLNQKQMDSMFYIMKAKKTDKNKSNLYISKLTLIKIIVYFVLNLEIRFPIVPSFSGLVMGARFGNSCSGCMASRLQLY